MERYDEKERHKKELFIVAIIVVIEAICTYYYPLTGDDRYFKSLNIQGCNQLLHYIKTFGNGRYLGNLAVILLVNHAVIRMIVKTICITGIWKMIVYLSDVKDIWKEALIAILVIFPSSLLSAQVYVWTAGFCNYVICIFLELLALGCLKKIEDCKEIYSKVLLVIMLIISVFLAQLCSENSTVINVITAVIILLQKIIDQKGKIASFILGISTCAGVCIMFLGPKICNVAYKMDNYRGGAKSVGTIISNIIYNILTINRCMLGNISLLLILSVIIYIIWKQENIYGKYFLISFGVCSIIYYLMDNDREWVYPNLIFRNIISMIPVTMFVLYIGYILLKSKFNRIALQRKLCINYVLIVVSILELLFVTPIGARTIYITYILFVAFVAQLLNELQITLEQKNLIYRIEKAFLVVFLMFNSFMWMNIHYADKTRENYIKMQMMEGKNEIDIPALPKQDYLWNDTMIENSFDCLYKYDHRGDIKFNVQTWDSWYAEYSENIIK